MCGFCVWRFLLVGGIFPSRLVGLLLLVGLVGLLVFLVVFVFQISVVGPYVFPCFVFVTYNVHAS